VRGSCRTRDDDTNWRHRLVENVQQQVTSSVRSFAHGRGKHDVRAELLQANSTARMSLAFTCVCLDFLRSPPCMAGDNFRSHVVTTSDVEFACIHAMYYGPIRTFFPRVRCERTQRLLDSKAVH
jgi:hypothetical protein